MTEDATQHSRMRNAKWVGDILGFTAQTVRNMADRGELPHSRIGKNRIRRFPEDKILEIVNNAAVDATKN